MKRILGLMIIVAVFIFKPSFAEVEAPVPDLKRPLIVDDHQHDYMRLQVIQDQFVLDNSTIRHAAIIRHRDGSYAGLEILLKPAAVSALEQMTKNAVGKNINLMIDKKLIAMPMIQTPLGQKFMIASITQDQAQAFIRALNFNKHAPITVH